MPRLQLKAAVEKATKEQAELQAMVQQAATELSTAQQQLTDGSSQQVRQTAGVGRRQLQACLPAWLAFNPVLAPPLRDLPLRNAPSLPLAGQPEGRAGPGPGTAG